MEDGSLSHIKTVEDMINLKRATNQSVDFWESILNMVRSDNVQGALSQFSEHDEEYEFCISLVLNSRSAS